MNMISMRNVTFGYKKKLIFNDFSISIEKGKVCGLLGKNGAGKSTMLYLLTGLLSPEKGKVEYKDEDVAKRKPSTLQDMFIVPEEFELPGIPLRKYVEINRPFYPSFSREQLDKNLECFEMEADVHLNELSLGQKKKVFMSFALAANTPLLLMDEPTNGLDIPGKSQFRKFIASGMTDEKTILISTHQVQDVDKLLEQVIILDNNKVLMNSSVSRICEKLRFMESYNEKDVEKALYASPSIQGYKLILENENNEETSLNLETLFNATLSNTEKITAILQ
ncbi:MULTISPECIES: ABC transporter ATP-binding protein [unclassified Dysgonomonas]|jgi:ABC-2 type transport system ATP-binding protein|uniref:ABC transporter ATP-binding protein n=1 Tax=unclassified Dysgonomonas TaxID=2630389 RepID=UPI0025BE7096|nr:MULTISPECIES: ABC transporter ATP-binding protein [unclassified Dysgonomonas]MDR2003191.1 ABC transporter ATP-binding protein [Prevotella sp.]HMM02401.1 ABC transporter ATP-binding protein [Dysgonomonas sp.]